MALRSRHASCVLVAAAMSALCSCSYTVQHLDRRHGLDGERMAASDVRVEDVPVKGHLVSLRRLKADGNYESVEGELLAVEARHLWLLIEKGKKRRRIARKTIEAISVEVHPSDAEALGLWTGVGIATAASHGYFAALTIPVWLLFGLPSALSAAAGNDINVPLNKLDLLKQWARFPAGMPGRHRPAREAASRPAASRPSASRPATSRPTQRRRRSDVPFFR